MQRGRRRRSVPQNMGRLKQLNQQNQQNVGVPSAAFAAHPAALAYRTDRPHGPKQAPGGEGVVGTGMDRIGKVGCGRGVHTAHAQYYSLLISLKLPGSNTLCATHAKGTGHVLPSSPVSQLPVLTHPRNIPFFFFYFSLCESAPSDAHPSRVSLLPSQYKALPSSGDLSSATCNPLALKLLLQSVPLETGQQRTACSSFFVC